jgi:hypothetical protein
MSGIHADRGDTSHRLATGEPPVVGMRVINNDLRWGTIVQVETEGECGWYCPAWHRVLVDGDAGTKDFNCERLATHYAGHADPHPAP